MRVRRTPPGAVRGRIAPIPPPGGARWPPCPRPRASLRSAPPRAQRGRGVVPRPSGPSHPSGPGTPGGIATWGGRGRAWSRRRRTPVRSAARTCRRTAPLSPHLGVRRPSACWLWRSGAWSRTAGPTVRRGGPSGAPLASWCPLRPVRPGARRGEKRRRGAGPRTSWPGRGLRWRALGPPMRALPALAVCSPPSRIAAPGASSPRAWRRRLSPRTCERVSGGSKRPWGHAAGPGGASRRMVRRARLPPSGR